MYLFSLEDIKNFFPGEKLKTIKNNFIRWLSKGYFVRLKRDCYELVDKAAGLVIPDLYVANRLYEPSYISLETALSIYSIIPDIAAGVTSVTTLPTRIFKNKYGSFFYRTCQKKNFLGYRLLFYEGFKVCIADKEKALVDFLYYRLRSGGSFDFPQERLNKKILKKMDWKKALQYARLFNRRTVKLLKECKGYVKC
jgi:predicted transcriptional regulator of viral defense system